MKCPQFQTEAAQVDNFWICPVHGQLAGPKPPEAKGDRTGALLPSSGCLPPSHAPLRIFLSYALDNFPTEHAKRDPNASGNRHYNDSVYTRLGL